MNQADWLSSRRGWPFVLKAKVNKEENKVGGPEMFAGWKHVRWLLSIGRFIQGRCDDDGQASDVFPPVKYQPPVDAPLPEKKGTAKILIRPNCLVEWTSKSGAT